jgi:hypothetical protein
MKDSPESLEVLSSRVDELERRVHALEHPAAKAASARSSGNQPGRDASEEVSLLEAGNFIPTLGRALLGIAGAYLLRAIAEANLIPKIVVAAFAILYAFGWLTWASRTGRLSRITQVVYAATSALILLPMLWEVTLHFQVYAPVVAATVLASFAVLGTVLDVRSAGSRLSWITHCAVGLSAIALGLGTHHMLPFVYLLLIALALSEFVNPTNGGRVLAALLALTADLAVWGMLFIYSGPQNARTDYPELSAAALVLPACLLFAINASGEVARCMIRAERISAFDIVQSLIAFLLATSSVFLFAAGDRAMLGLACLILAGVLYWVSFRQLKHLADKRNFSVVALWSAALLLVGVLWSLPQSFAAAALAIAAPVAYWFGRRFDLRAPELHGSIFLVAATILSAMHAYVFRTLAGALPFRPSLAGALVAICAALAYAIAKTTGTENWQSNLLRFVPALVATCALTAFFAQGLLSTAALVAPLDAHHVAFLRTLSISLVALCLAFAGSHWRRAAMTHLAYVALIFVAAKFFFEDLRHGHMEFVAGSIFLFAISLMAVPRLVRLGARSRAANPDRPVATKA